MSSSAVRSVMVESGNVGVLLLVLLLLCFVLLVPFLR